MWWLSALALAGPTDVSSETIRSGSVRSRLAGQDGADLVLFYTAEHKGKLGTCGCPANPRGGFSRMLGYVQRARKASDSPDLLLHAGWWASDDIGHTTDLRPDALLGGRATLKGLEFAEFDAVNISFHDAPLFRSEDIPGGFVATNGGLEGHAVQWVEVDGLTVAVAGVGRQGLEFMQPDGFSWTEPVAALKSLLPELRERADLVVVLAYDTGRDTSSIARLDGVDVVIEAGAYAGKDEPWLEQGTAWVRARDDGQSVGELRLWLDSEGKVARARDRWVDLDARIPSDRGLHRLEQQSRREVDAALEAWFADEGS